MKLPINIENLLSGQTVESTRIEYKKSWNPEPIMHTICAFANDIENLGGGYVVLGVEEENGMPRHSPSGISKDSIDLIQKELLNICNLIVPRYIPVIETTRYHEENIIVIWVYGGTQRPYKCPISLSRNAKEQAYYIRKLASTIQANQTEIKEIFSLSENIPYDDRVNPSASIEDLRPALISNFLYEVKSELYESSLSMPLKELAKNLRIIDGPTEYLKPQNVGLMFFNERPDRFFHYARIEVVDKPDETGAGMTEKYFTGPLDRQLKDALEYIRNYVIKEQVMKYPDREEADRVYNYPYAAVEEALTNAVHHKSYQVPEPIVVTITPEQMEIVSLPGPDKSISSESIAKLRFVSSRYRNRRVGEFLKELKLVEGRNTGIPTILRSLMQNGSGKPVFETDEDRTYFRVILPVHEKFVPRTKTVADVPKQRKTRRSREMLRLDVLEVLKSGDFSSAEVALHLGYKYPYSGLLPKVIAELVADGSVEYTEAEKKNSRYQKLRLRR